jgi:probable HAF family extracellular repeat protein
MKGRGLLAASVAIFAIGSFVAPGHRALAARQNRYVAIDLGAFGEGAIAWAINNQGQVVGQIGTRSFLWESGVVRDLGAMTAWGINDRGEVVGEAGGHAVVWENGRLRNLPSDAFVVTVALAINNRGQIVGMCRTRDQVEHACLWENDVVTDLGAPAARPPYSRAIGINERGQILGYSTPDLDTACIFVWNHGVFDNVFCRPGAQSRFPVGITNSGDVAATGFPSLLFTHAGTIELPVFARGVSPNGLVACEFRPSALPHACLWDRGVVTDLGVSFSGLSVALAVNSRAELVGWFFDEATQLNHAVLWRPAAGD